jgi:hypothetical protein
MIVLLIKIVAAGKWRGNTEKADLELGNFPSGKKRAQRAVKSTPRRYRELLLML